MRSQRKALTVVGLARSSWQYRHQPRPPVEKPIPQAERAYPNRISAADQKVIAARISAAWEQGNSVDHAHTAAWDEGIMLGSPRSWWRIAQKLEQDARPKIPTRQGVRIQRVKPVVEATGPGQVLCWDITDCPGKWKGQAFKAYQVTDIFTREIVGSVVHEGESAQLAVELFEKVIAEHGAPVVVHADNGPAMKSKPLRECLEAHGVRLSHNRPYVSDDNPYAESAFRTMKYRPDYPGVFKSLKAARKYVSRYVAWYNDEHRHSGIAHFTPAQVSDGSWQQVWHVRDEALQRYFAEHPERFHAPPSTPTPPGSVGINLPKPEQNQPS